MNRFMLLASAASITLIGSAYAGEHTSVTDVRDTHIKVVTYSATKRTQITGLLGQPVTISFPAAESVYRVVQTKPLSAKDDSVMAAWEGPKPEEVKDAPLGNNLTIWPMREGITIMNVITMGEHGGQKSYAFRLVAKPDPTGLPDDPDAVFNVIFKGGSERAPTQTTAADPPASKKAARSTHQDNLLTVAQNENELAADRLRTDSFNQASGCHYHAQGQKPNPLEPLCPLDNGIFTIMRFSGLSAKPAIYVVALDGSERLARQHASGDFVVIEEIAAHFRLRLMPSVLDILNDAYSPAGNPTGTGTTSPGAERQILQSSKQ